MNITELCGSLSARLKTSSRYYKSTICTAVYDYGAESMNHSLRYWLFPILTFEKGQRWRCYRIIKCNNIYINGPACCYERPSSLRAKTCLTENP